MSEGWLGHAVAVHIRAESPPNLVFETFTHQEWQEGRVSDLPGMGQFVDEYLSLNGVPCRPSTMNGICIAVTKIYQDLSIDVRKRELFTIRRHEVGQDNLIGGKSIPKHHGRKSYFRGCHIAIIEQRVRDHPSDYAGYQSLHRYSRTKDHDDTGRDDHPDQAAG